MPDPIDELENFDPGAPMTPLPPSEVRRLGDRHRRRRTTGVALAAAAAVAVVATGGAVLAGGGEPRTIDPAPPSPSVTTPSGPLIPDSLDVTGAMVENDSGEPATQAHGAPGLSTVDFCEAGPPFADDGRVDSVAATTSGPEYGDTREVVLYPDEKSAAAVLEELTVAARDCPRESGSAGSALHEVRSWDLGESGVVVVRTYTDSLGAEIMHFTRVGEALLAASTFGDYDPRNTEDGEAEEARHLRPIVSQLCVLYDASCASGTAVGTSTPEAVDDIPEGFPLAAGWPTRHEPGADYGLTGPDPEVEVLENLPACDPGVPAPEAIDRLGASWADIEDYRYRLLLTFEDADGAIAYQRRLVDTYRGCPTTDDGEGNGSVTDVRQTRVGGESWAFVRTFEYLGAPALGMEAVHVIRLGRSLLIDGASTHGGGGPDLDAQASAQIAEQTTESVDVVSAMCAFTEAGCR